MKIHKYSTRRRKIRSNKKQTAKDVSISLTYDIQYGVESDVAESHEETHDGKEAPIWRKGKSKPRNKGDDVAHKKRPPASNSVGIITMVIIVVS